MSAHRGQFDVFFSYAWEDIDLAVRLVAALELRGLSVFRDEPALCDHDEIAPAVAAALMASRAVGCPVHTGLPAQ
jgi:TIR domain-containing protein